VCISFQKSWHNKLLRESIVSKITHSHTHAHTHIHIDFVAHLKHTFVRVLIRIYVDRHFLELHTYTNKSI